MDNTAASGLDDQRIIRRAVRPTSLSLSGEAFVSGYFESSRLAEVGVSDVCIA